MKFRLRDCFFFGWLLTVLLASSVSRSALAQSQSRSASQTFSVTETFEPTFHIEPLMHRIEGRSGDVVGFKFLISSANFPRTIKVAPVALRQELSGQILNDTDLVNSDDIKFLTPSTMELLPNVSSVIEGVVKIPGGDAKYHSLGVLVRDLGPQVENKLQTNPDGSQKTQAGIRFITQYVLRLDIQVNGARGEAVQKLVIENVEMQSFHGRPLFETVISNPTETIFEFELQTRLRSSPSDQSAKSLRLVMPVRSSMQSDERYIGRILPKSRIKMQGLLPEAIASGSYSADLELFSEGHLTQKKTLALDVDADDFPAQQVLITQVADGLLASPAQVELSQLRGGSRRVIMLFKNNSKTTKSIQVSARGNNELELPSVIIQPSQFELGPSASRKIALTLKGTADAPKAAEYGSILVSSQADDKDFVETQAIPLAVMLLPSNQTTIEMSPVVWDPNGKYPVFRTMLSNSGECHLPVDARLSIVNSTGTRISIPGGFGRWLMPGSKWPLEFRLDRPLTAGDYQLTCEIQTGTEPITTVQNFTVSDFDKDLTRAVSVSEK